MYKEYSWMAEHVPISSDLKPHLNCSHIAAKAAQ